MTSNPPSTQQTSSTYTPPPPKTLYTSLSVNCRLPSTTTFTTGTAQIIERDLGTADDFWHIHVNLIWTSRAKPPDSPPSLNVSIDDLLTLRLRLDVPNPLATIHLRGGKHLCDLQFPNGPEAAMAFWTALRTRIDSLPLKDEFNKPQLYMLEKKPRMRRAVPELVGGFGAEEDFSSFLQGLSLHDGGSRRRGRLEEKEDLGRMLLSQFAKVTQAARVVGEEVSTILDEKKRREDMARRQRERAARRRALDIYAEIVASTDVERELPPRLTLDEVRGVAVDDTVWREAFGEDGRLKDPVVMRCAVFAGGVEKGIRKLVWPFLLGVFEWGSTGEERRAVEDKLKREYGELRGKWEEVSERAKEEEDKSLEEEDAVGVDRGERVSKEHCVCLDVAEQIEKDIVRTDRLVDLFRQDDAPATIVMGRLLNVYASYDAKIGYCQGMSDFLSPVIHVVGVDNEAMAFWCFERLMRRVECNFRVDQSGMRSQLAKLKSLVTTVDPDLAAFFDKTDPDYYCCFRWVLVRFKRELDFEATARCWEVLWTRHVGGDELHLFVAAALLKAHRRQILALPEAAFDSLLRYINDMSMRIDVDFALREGEMLCRKYSSVVR